MSPSFEAQSMGTRRPLGEPQADREQIRLAAAGTACCLLWKLVGILGRGWAGQTGD